MAEFVQEYSALRWAAVAAFLVAAAIVLARSTAVAESFTASETGARAESQVSRGDWHALDHAESDAAHLLMCLVMLGMLLFPGDANPRAVDGVLTAMVVVFAGLAAVRIMECGKPLRLIPIDRLAPLGYHLVAAAAMLYAMSGHTTSGHTGGPSIGPALASAAVFLADAAIVSAVYAGWSPARARGPLGALAHAAGCGAGRPAPWAAVPHLVMDAGTAYMLIAAVLG